jgi:hypothetical protein
MGFSATDAAFEGFKVVRRHPMTIVFWALLYIVVTAIGFAVAGPLVISVFSRIEALQTATTAGAEPSLADMQSLMGSYGLLLGLIGPMSIVMGAVLNAGIARSVVRPSEKAFGYLRLGIDEIRVLVVGLVLKLVIFAAFMAGVVVTTALGVLAYTSGVAVLWIAVVLLGVATVGVVVWLMLRFSLAVPIIIAEHRWALFDSFAMTKGRSLTFLGMAIIAGVMGILVAMLGNIVAMPLQLPLERAEALHQRLGGRRGLDAADVAAAAVADAGLGDLGVLDGVGRGDVLGRTMPATVSSRTSRLVRTSCRPWITRLPLAMTPVTTAAMVRLTFSDRLTAPEPDALDLARQCRPCWPDRSRPGRPAEAFSRPKKLLTPARHVVGARCGWSSSWSGRGRRCRC